MARDYRRLADPDFPKYAFCMTANASILARDGSVLSMAVLVLPQASILEVASVLDPMRAANRHLGREAFTWRVVSPDGGAVPLTCGLELPSSGGLEAARGAQALCIIAGFRQAEVATARLVHDLRRMAPRATAVIGIDAGPWVMARAGLLDGRRATVHWEDLEDLAAAHPGVEVVPDRYVIDGNRITAGGAAPASDLMLHIIAARHGQALALQVANSFLTTARLGSEPQIGAMAPAMAADPRVLAAINRIEARIESPEAVAATARAVGVSLRRLETLFRADLGLTPGAYGAEARLQAARRLVADTRHPLRDVALRTGFSAQSALSRAFHRRFGQSPSALRRALRTREPTAGRIPATVPGHDVARCSDAGTAGDSA
jgi:transcriptional regulator GlxA family with amidase domain